MPLTDEQRKELEYTDKILELFINQQTDDAMTASDLQGCIHAVIIRAIAYGRTLETIEREVAK
jgi:hypothetical protein